MAASHRGRGQKASQGPTPVAASNNAPSSPDVSAGELPPNPLDDQPVQGELSNRVAENPRQSEENERDPGANDSGSVAHPGPSLTNSSTSAMPPTSYVSSASPPWAPSGLPHAGYPLGIPIAYNAGPGPGYAAPSRYGLTGHEPTTLERRSQSDFQRSFGFKT